MLKLADPKSASRWWRLPPMALVYFDRLHDQADRENPFFPLGELNYLGCEPTNATPEIDVFRKFCRCRPNPRP